MSTGVLHSIIVLWHVRVIPEAVVKTWSPYVTPQAVHLMYTMEVWKLSFGGRSREWSGDAMWLAYVFQGNYSVRRLFTVRGISHFH